MLLLLSACTLKGLFAAGVYKLGIGRGAVLYGAGMCECLRYQDVKGKLPLVSQAVIR
jgi:hypothetical protein